MTRKEAEEYYDKLTVKEAHRFNLLVSIARKLGKPDEGCYDYAKTIMESEKNGS